MKVSYPYLKDEKFLVLADTQRLQTQHIKLTLLDWDENPIQTIQGIATGGTISLNGSSAIRRTCSLNMTVDEIAETAITSVKNLISINKKLFLEIGIENKTNKYPEYPILWYPQGTFVFTSCNLSSGIGQGYTLSAQLKDKMCLLNGECGGIFTSSVELDKYDTLDSSTGEIYTTKNTISQIIRELVNHFGKIPLDKIIINDIDEKIKMTMRWSGDTPLYLAQKDSSYLYTTSYTEAIAYGGNIKIFQYGEDCGFTLTDFIYPSELIANIGDNICTILDKIKNILGNYEYYFDIDGNFIFQEIKNYLNTTQATVDLQNMKNEDYKIDIAKGKSIYDFKGAELITSYSNNPNYSNIKNDYVVWGIRENTDKIKIPIRYHLAIDNKPKIGNLYRVYMYYDIEDGLLKAKMPIGFDDKSHFPTVGNEDLFYWDKSTGFVYKWDVDKQMYVSPDGKQYSAYNDIEPGNSNTIYVDNAELNSGSGTTATLINTVANRTLSFNKYEGSTSQEGTPTPTSPQPINVVTGDNTINVVGKNLFSGFIKGYGLNSTNGSIISSSTSAISEYISVDFDTYSSYYVNGLTDTISSYIAGYNERGQFIGRTGGTPRTSTEITPSNFTGGTPQGTGSIKYIIITQYKVSGQTGTIDDIDNLQVMLNTGSTPIPYEAYIGQKYEIDLDKNVFDKESSGITTGKYLLNDGSLVSGSAWSVSDYIEIQSNTTYKTNAGNTLGTNPSRCYYDSNKTFISGVKHNGSNPFIDTSPSNAKYMRESYQTNDLDSVTITYNAIELNKIGTYQDTIFKSSGKNLFDKEAVTTGKWLNQSGELENAGNYVVSDYIEVKEGETYYLPNRNTTRTKYYKEDKSVYSNDWDVTSGAQAITIPSSVKYIRFSILVNGANAIDINTFIFNKGTTALPYEPYGSGWFIKKNIGKVVLDGSESSWALHNSNANRNVYRITKTDKLPYTNNADIPKMFSNYFNPVPNNATWVIGNLSEGSSSSWVYFVVEPTYTLETFKTWLSTHNTTLYYILNTPTYTKITDKTLISQLNKLKNATTYDNLTNIIQNNSNLPLTIDYTYYTKKEDSSLSQRYTWEIDPSSEHYLEIIEEINHTNEIFEENTADERDAIAALQIQIQEYENALTALDITYKTELTREKSLERQIANLQGQEQTAAVVAKILELQDELATLQAGDLAPYYTSKSNLESAISTIEASIETNQAAINEAAEIKDETIASLTAWLGEYKLYIDNNFVTIQTADWRSELYLSGVAAEALGLDQNYYYAELAAEWPKLYNLLANHYIDSETGETIYVGDFTDEVKNNPWSVDYWLDFIDSESAIGGLSIDNIGRRSITKSSDDYNCVFESDIPDLVLIKEDTETTDEEREACEKRGQDYCQVESSIYDLLVSGGWANSCFNEIKNLLWFNTSYNSSINLSLIPIYHLEPNTRITVQSIENDIYGDYMMNSLSIPLTYNGTMSISATQVQTKL